MRPFVFIILALTMVFFSCTEKHDKAVARKFTRQLIPLDHNDTNFCYGRPYDTTLQSGWTIQYLVRDDTTKYHDVYIRWTKAGKSGLFFGEHLLDFRTYFVSEFSGENDENLFMEHGCATSCAGLLVLNKQNLRHRDFAHIVSYDIKTNKIVWLSDENFANDGNFVVTATDLSTNNDTAVAFSNLALGSLKESYVDTVLFSKRSVTIKCTLLDAKDDTRQREVKETKTLKL